MIREGSAIYRHPRLAAAAGAVLLLGGYLLLRPRPDPMLPTRAAAPDASVERFQVPLGDAAVQGRATAKLTLVAYVDYQCRFSAQAEATLAELRRHYGKELRTAIKHNPLSFHPHAATTARAALAAREQGDEAFSRFHAQLFQHQDRLAKDQLPALAATAGLDAARLGRDLQRNRAAYDARIQADQAEAARLGARATPSFFVNGRPLSGAQPLAAFRRLLDEELAVADQALRAGASRENLYATLLQDGKTAGAAPPPPRPIALPQLGERQRYQVAVSGAPSRGPASARVTLVEFGDLQDPFTAQVERTLGEVMRKYGPEVRIVFKHAPQPAHPHAALAAQATLAALDQGRFWELQTKLLDNPQALDRPSLERHAKDAGLHLGRFNAALDGGTGRLDADRAEARRLGVTTTPTFFINGRRLVGAQPFAAFQPRIDEALREAEALMAERRLPAGQVYSELMKSARPPSPAAL